MGELWGSVVTSSMESASAFQTLVVEEDEEAGYLMTNAPPPVFYGGRRSPIWKQKLFCTFFPEIKYVTPV